MIDTEIWEELNRISEIESAKNGSINYMEENIITEDFLAEMPDVTGKYVQIEDIDFSFYLSVKNSSHGIRVKVCWNRERLIPSECGYIELHGNYNYYQSRQMKYQPKSYEIYTLRYFVKKYKVLFSAVWEGKLEADDVSEYFKGRLSFEKFMRCFYAIPTQIKNVFINCRNLKELEYAVRKNRAFCMND